ncbi:MAG: hypothetical protein RL687_317 [Candidatus Parcubacteria bacterium]
MKKFGVYILLFTIIANLFAPLSLQKNNQSRNIIRTNIASADETDTEIIDACKKSGVAYCISIRPTSAASSINTAVVLRLNIYTTESWATNENLFVHLSMKEKNSGAIILDKNILDSAMEKVDNPYAKSKDLAHYTIQTLTNKGLNPETEYITTVDSMSIVKANVAGGVAGSLTTISIIAASSCVLYFIPGVNLIALGVTAVGALAYFTYDAFTNTTTNRAEFKIEFKTPVAAKEGAGSNVTVGDKTYQGSSADSIMPACGIVPKALGGSDGTVMGCVVQAFYYIFFVSTSFIFALAGKLFDFAFHYSIQDTSYRLGFVTEGWKIVRDLCNMFFIFLLLSAAIKMILNIGHGEKSTIVKVIIIGLLINFSLFTTHIVIDASNILARLFYNSDAINVVVNGNQDVNGVGSVSSYVYGGDDQLPLSAALVDKVDPQAIIIGAKNINTQTIDNGKVTNPNAAEMEQANQGIGVGAFFLVTLLAVIINLIGIFVFISVALIFIGRVVGLWFSMIFVPLAFFSYAAPNLPEGLSRFGWKSWWSELIGTAFVAPVFMFMLYLILLFLSKGFVDIFDGDSYGAEFVLKTIIPFIVIMILLMKSKDVAGDMSKGVASAATTGLKVAGGAALALGGAGVGVVGRNVIGKTFAKASSGNTLTQQYETAERAAAKGDFTLRDDYNRKNRFQRIMGQAGSRAGFGKVFGKQNVAVERDEFGATIQGTAKVSGVLTGIGGKVNKSQKNVGDINHAVHDYAEIAKKAHINPEIPYSKLGPLEKAAFDKKFKEEKRNTTESNISKGLVAGVQGENEYKSANFDRAKSEFVENKYRNEAGLASTDVLTPTQRLELDARQRVPTTTNDTNAINTKLGNEYKETVLKHETDHKLDHDLEHTTTGSAKKISMGDRLTADSTRGSYNPLNISKLDSIKNDAFATRLIFGISSAVALGMRSGLKNQASVNMGSGSLKFTEDMKNLFSDAIKGASIKLESPGGGGGHGGGHDDHGHGGGHDDHGGGHH